MNKVLESEEFLQQLATSRSSKERLKLLNSATQTQLVALFELIYNFVHNPNIQQLALENRKKTTLLRKLKSFRFSKKTRGFKLNRLRNLLIKFNVLLPSLLSIILNNVINYLRDNFT